MKNEKNKVLAESVLSEIQDKYIFLTEERAWSDECGYEGKNYEKDTLFDNAAEFLEYYKNGIIGNLDKDDEVYKLLEHSSSCINCLARINYILNLPRGFENILMELEEEILNNPPSSEEEKKILEKIIKKGHEAIEEIEKIIETLEENEEDDEPKNYLN